MSGLVETGSVKLRLVISWRDLSRLVVSSLDSSFCVKTCRFKLRLVVSYRDLSRLVVSSLDSSDRVETCQDSSCQPKTCWIVSKLVVSWKTTHRIAVVTVIFSFYYQNNILPVENWKTCIHKPYYTLWYIQYNSQAVWKINHYNTTTYDPSKKARWWWLNN